MSPDFLGFVWADFVIKALEKGTPLLISAQARHLASRRFWHRATKADDNFWSALITSIF